MFAAGLAQAAGLRLNTNLQSSAATCWRTTSRAYWISTRVQTGG